MAGLTGRFIVEDWYTDQIIVEFRTYEERQNWLSENVNEDGYMADGRKISIYEFY